ncbi:unnamed protein product [Musa textilis]
MKNEELLNSTYDSEASYKIGNSLGPCQSTNQLIYFSFTLVSHETQKDVDIDTSYFCKISFFGHQDSGGCPSGSSEQKESNASDEVRPSSVRRFNVPLVTKSTLEVIIPEHAVPSLIMRSGSKLAQISEISGAAVTLIEDRPEQTGKIVQISGSPEQAEKAQSLLLGFILSTQDDIPSNQSK